MTDDLSSFVWTENQIVISVVCVCVCLSVCLYHSTQNVTNHSFFRFYKPFNPLLGETFESVRDDLGYTVISEQVCHHPPITAMHCEAQHWCLWQEYKLDIRFRGQVSY
jgi:hypothetical protein